jgi:phospholipid/cholesterol/gamma-HCH transport system substrate-binding protein
VITRAVVVKLVAFAVVTVASLTYGLTDVLGVHRAVLPATTVTAVFADPQGLYPDAEVDLLGVRVGAVTEIEPGPGRSSTVVIQLDPGAEVPADVVAVSSAKSAIGEQYVHLRPRSGEGPLLADGDTITRTTSPPDVGRLIASLDELVGSVPNGAVRTVLGEGSRALEGLDPTIRRLLDDMELLSASARHNVDDLTGLIRDARLVLRTQVEVQGDVRTSARELSGLMRALRRLDPTFDRVLVRGVAAGRGVADLLRDNQRALPVLLNDLATLTEVVGRHTPAIRKSLVVFPWALEYNSQALRYCDKVDPVTGDPVEATCHYDDAGRPVWSAHVADVIKARGSEPVNPCSDGYEATPRYLADGRPADGKGPRQKPNAEPHPGAGCTAPPDDPVTPNVRGFQNISPSRGGAGRAAPGWGLALLNPDTGVLTRSQGPALELTSISRPMPVDGSADLGWLMTQNLT